MRYVRSPYRMHVSCKAIQAMLCIYASSDDPSSSLTLPKLPPTSSKTASAYTQTAQTSRS